MFFSLVRKERKGQKEESFDSRLGDADTHASHMCQSPLGVFFLIAFSFAPVYAKEKADGEFDFSFGY